MGTVRVSRHKVPQSTQVRLATPGQPSYPQLRDALANFYRAYLMGDWCYYSRTNRSSRVTLPTRALFYCCVAKNSAVGPYKYSLRLDLPLQQANEQTQPAKSLTRPIQPRLRLPPSPKAAPVPISPGGCCHCVTTVQKSTFSKAKRAILGAGPYGRRLESHPVPKQRPLCSSIVSVVLHAYERHPAPFQYRQPGFPEASRRSICCCGPNGPAQCRAPRGLRVSRGPFSQQRLLC